MIAPSGAVDADRLARGVAILEGWGLRVEVGNAVLERHTYLAGDDRVRLADLERMLDDDRVRAIFCARGGYGSQRLLPLLDPERLARGPKPIVGYSDATALLNAAVGAGVVAVHGPMVADDLARGLTERSAAQLHGVLTDPAWQWEVEAARTIVPGRARGRLVGGCLAVIAAAVGTPWAPSTDGAILFLEDVAERPYRLDRLLTQLRQAGKLDRLAGLVFGAMAACPEVDGIGPFEVATACCADLSCPVAFGVAAGHDPRPSGCENLALPLGVQVELDTERGRLTALEAAVV
ncbi:MAG TPA: LD-carboxypeptidase [Candidatus Binatia bacterium]|nr:LD-carboxypeptidase [Candidatus Binatia bacterium]